MKNPKAKALYSLQIYRDKDGTISLCETGNSTGKNGNFNNEKISLGWIGYQLRKNHDSKKSLLTKYEKDGLIQFFRNYLNDKQSESVDRSEYCFRAHSDGKCCTQCDAINDALASKQAEIDHLKEAHESEMDTSYKRYYEITALKQSNEELKAENARLKEVLEKNGNGGAK